MKLFGFDRGQQSERVHVESPFAWSWQEMLERINLFVLDRGKS